MNQRSTNLVSATDGINVPTKSHQCQRGLGHKSGITLSHKCWNGWNLGSVSTSFASLPSLDTRRLLPVVAPDRGLCDAVGEAGALFWQLISVAGGCWSVMHTMCSRVRATVTDLRVERVITNQPGLAQEEFFRLCSCPVPVNHLQFFPV